MRRKRENKRGLIVRFAHRLGWQPGRAMSEALEWIQVLAVAGLAAVLVMSFVTVRMRVPTGSMIPTIDPSDSFFVDRISYLFRDPNPGDIVVFWHTDRVTVRSVDRDSVAALVGIEPGARVVTVNHETIFDAADADRVIDSLPEGSVVFLGVEGPLPLEIGIKTAEFSSLEDLGIRLRDHRIRYVKRLIATGGQVVQILEGGVFVDGYRLMGERFDRTYTAGDPRMKYGVAPTLVPEGRLYVLGDNSADSWDSRYWGFVDEGDVIGEPYLRVWPLPRFGAMNGYFGSS
jgi:signal peptidase I